MRRALGQVVGVDVDDVAADALGRGEGQREVLVPASYRIIIASSSIMMTSLIPAPARTRSRETMCNHFYAFAVFAMLDSAAAAVGQCSGYLMYLSTHLL